MMEQLYQFKLQHACAAVTTFALAGAVYPREEWLGAMMLLATSGVWIGVLLLMFSNAADGKDFEYRSQTNQSAVAAAQILISACGTVGVLLWSFVVLGILQYAIGF